MDNIVYYYRIDLIILKQTYITISKPQARITTEFY